MANLITEIYSNGITKGFDKQHSSIKNIMSAFSNINANTLNKIKLIQDNILFKDIGTDILVKCYNKPHILSAIKKYNYVEIKKEEFPFAEYNYAGVNSKINYIQNFDEYFKDEVSINGIELNYFFQEDFIIFVEKNSSKSKYFYQISDVKIQDVKIDSDLFLYLLCSQGNSQFLIKTHLAKSFSKYNVENTKFDLNEVFYKVNIANNPKNFYQEILKIKHNEVFLKGENLEKILLFKKYFFIENEFVYFNHYGELEQYKDNLIEEIQTNFSNLYNYINFLGLNNFKIKGRKISTFENDVFLNIFRNKFDNTFNGGTNYFLVKNHFDNYNDKTKETFKLNPDYQIDINDSIFSINGNFNYKFKNSEFKITIENDLITLSEKQNNGTYIFLDKCKILNKDEFYFYNLKFQLKTFNLPKYYSFLISAKDNYIFKQCNVKVKLEKIFNNKNIVDKLLKLDKNYNNNSVEFKNNSIIFNNKFCWNNKKFSYHNLEDTLKANKPFYLKDIKEFYTEVQYDIKDNFLLPRNNGKIIFTNQDKTIFSLIDNNGNITDFWKNNSGKEVYFKLNKNATFTINNKKEADIAIAIPKIEDYIDINSKVKNIDILINDEMQFTHLNQDNVILTTKFNDEPLFFKVFVEELDAEKINIFDNENNYISNYYSEKYKNGNIVYFNKEYGKKYFYTINSKDEKVYFEPIKAHENIMQTYSFDQLGKIQFETPNDLQSLSLISNKEYDRNFKCTLFLYNYIKKEVKKVDIDYKSLNKSFDINFIADSIKIESDFDIKHLQLIDKSNTSIIENNNIVYFKEKNTDICYITKFNEGKIDYMDIINKIKTKKFYSLINGKLVEDNKGNIFLNNLLDDSLYIEELNKELKIEKNVFKSFSTSKYDEFYINNFKSLNIEHEFLNEQNISIITENKRLIL